MSGQLLVEDPDEVQCPMLAKPQFLVEADELRAFISTIMVEYETSGTSPKKIMKELIEKFDNREIWEAAFRCPYEKEDIPFCEFAKRNLHGLIGDVLAILPYDEHERKRLIEAPGGYGRTAIQHAVSSKNWKTVDILVRHGAQIGFASDQLGIVDSITKAARGQRKTGGSWRNIDRPLSSLLVTLSTFHGEHWLTQQPCAHSDNGSDYDSHYHSAHSHSGTNPNSMSQRSSRTMRDFMREQSTRSVSFGSIEEEDSYTSLKAALRDNVFSMSPTLSPKLPAKDNSSGSASNEDLRQDLRVFNFHGSHLGIKSPSTRGVGQFWSKNSSEMVYSARKSLSCKRSSQSTMASATSPISNAILQMTNGISKSSGSTSFGTEENRFASTKSRLSVDSSRDLDTTNEAQSCRSCISHSSYNMHKRVSFSDSSESPTPDKSTSK